MIIEMHWLILVGIIAISVVVGGALCLLLVVIVFSPKSLAARREENIAKLKQEIKDSRTEQNEGDGK